MSISCPNCGIENIKMRKRCYSCCTSLRGNSYDTEERNRKIYGMYSAGGITLRELAEHFGITFQRVHQICQRQAQIRRPEGAGVNRRE